jgi:hypothetical protein
LASLLGRKRKGRRRGAAGSARLRRRAGEAEGRRKGRGEGEADRWGPGVSDSKRKEKERERGGPVRGDGRWAAGPFGPKGKEVRFCFFFFFKLLFKTTLLFKFKSKPFQTFSQKFINFLETTQATKNHASQLMMHNHLLSLSLLNYV